MRKPTSLVAAACLLAAPLLSASLLSAPAAAQCAQGMVNVTAQRATVAGPNGFIATGAQLAAEVEGAYRLSNGRRLDLIDLDQHIYADFGKWSRVQLDEVGPHRFASREGDVQMTWLPGEQTDTIVLSYPADSRGQFRRGCG